MDSIVLNKNLEEYQKYSFNMWCNGDIFAEYWRPFTYEEQIKNGKPIEDGGFESSLKIVPCFCK